VLVVVALAICKQTKVRRINLRQTEKGGATASELIHHPTGGTSDFTLHSLSHPRVSGPCRNIPRLEISNPAPRFSERQPVQKESVGQS
jgi:hypothetical protein